MKNIMADLCEFMSSIFLLLALINTVMVFECYLSSSDNMGHYATMIIIDVILLLLFIIHGRKSFYLCPEEKLFED